MSRENHVKAIGLAGRQVQELEDIVIQAQAKLVDVEAIVVMAVGEEPNNEAGRSALEFTMALGNQLEVVIGVCEQIKRDLNEQSSLW